MKNLGSLLLSGILMAQANTVCAAQTDVTGLPAALQAVIAHHPALAGKNAELEAKRYASEGARSLRYPDLNFGVGYRDDEDARGDQQIGTLQVKQPLWGFGRIASQIDYADADVVVEEADLIRLQRTLLDEAAVAYAQVHGAHQLLDLAADNVAQHEALYARVKRRYAGQLAAEADVRLAASRVTQAQAQRARYQGELRITQAELKALTFSAVPAIQAIDPRYVEVEDNDQLLASVIRDASPELTVKRKRLALAHADKARARTSIMPQLSLQADHGLSDAAENKTRLMLVLEGSLGGAGARYSADVRAAEARITAAEQDLRTADNELGRQVDTLLAGYRLQQALIDSQAQSIAALEDTLDSYQRLYEAGHKAWLDVLNIQRELNEQRLQHQSALNELHITALRIGAAKGSFDSFMRTSDRLIDE